MTKATPWTVHLAKELNGLKSAGLYKSDRAAASTQSSEVKVADGNKSVELLRK